MRREAKNSEQPTGDLYLFRFPLTQDGVNQGNLPESQYIGNLRNYGSTTITPSFNDNLTFDSYYSQLAHRHTGNTDKLVSLVDYNNFSFNGWLNDNDFEFNLDFYFNSYAGYQTVLEMLRCSNSQTAGIDMRWLSSNFGLIYVGNGNTIALQQSGATYVTQKWVRANLIKAGTILTAVFTRLDNNTILSTKSTTWTNILTNGDVKYITVFGCYLDNNNANFQRYVVGATKNFYMKKL